MDSVVSEEANLTLMTPFHDDEFKKAIFHMKANKSPGPDGFNPGFFHKFWNLIRSTVIKNYKK